MSKPDPEDIKLFRETVGTVKPVVHDRVLPARRKPRPRPVWREQDEEQALRDMLSELFDPAEMETGEELIYLRPGLQQRTLRKLRRGRILVDAELDLHGMSVPVARAAVAGFLNECQRRHVQCARIIHGKGLGSRHRGPVLKGKIGGWLRQRNEVLAYCSARHYDGGTGALYVLLKRR
ncbi:MAG TPA: DNA mismatch repair protein MutS [Gammaproteobacteria bacterium]|nr:DNA mismatch repair protein MutS [Gammaproteobacteria bacterium]